MMWRALFVIAVLPLAACQPPVPNSGVGAGVGFGDYQDYLAQREAALKGQRAAPAPVSPPYGAPTAPGALTAEPIATAPLGAVPLGSLGGALPPRAGAQAAPANGAPLDAMAGASPAPLPNAPTAVAQANAAPLPRAASGAVISDENNFDAVAARETIESDKARMEANRAAYQQVQPGALPQRAGDAGPNLAAFALQSTNRLGEAVWKRGGLTLTNHARACARYPSADQAQMAFLQRGGPERDPGNLDPDGDGYACYWDPTPFQAARQ